MRWPPWSTDPKKEVDTSDERKSQTSWTGSLNATDWTQYTDPRTIVSTTVLTTAILFGVSVYRKYLRRIPVAASIKPSFFRRRSLFGTVTRVGDGDNFHLFHTPGGRLTGWGWLPWRKVPEKKLDLKNRTISVRIAGIDAPEGAHFGREAQPFSAEALEWLRNYILDRRVRAYIYKRDQYDRIVATVFVRRRLFRQDVGYQMLKAGLATVYEANSGAEFGKFEDRYRKTEAWARQKRIGIWSGNAKDFESPRDYKNRVNTLEKDVKEAKKGVLNSIVSTLTSPISKK